MKNPIGHKRWAIAEGYIPESSHGPEPEMTSHETALDPPELSRSKWRQHASGRRGQQEGHARLDHRHVGLKAAAYFGRELERSHPILDANPGRGALAHAAHKIL